MTMSNQFTQLRSDCRVEILSLSLKNVVCRPWQQENILRIKINQPEGVPVNCSPCFKFRWKLLQVEVGS